ncbi:MAG: hypothetical protein H7175_00920 [Burkholderiales bacterium]|nr:hypothetical protein [Anaerolineae bacterium]
MSLRRSDVLFVVIAAALVALYVATAGGGFPLDDSWIHQVYGRNLAFTGQWAFVPGIPSAASTSALYTVLLAIGYKLGIHYALWTHMIGVIALAVAGMLASRIAARILPESRYVGVASGLAVVTAWHLVWASASGMETMLFGMWTLVLIWLAVNSINPALRNSVSSLPASGEGIEDRTMVLRGAVFGVVAALATMTRPEGALLAGLIGGLMLIARPQGTWRGFILWGISAAIGFGVGIAPYFALNLSLTGGLLPNTAAAKQAENAPLLLLPYSSRIINLIFPLIAGGQLLLIPGMLVFAAFVVRRVRQDRRVWMWLVLLLWPVALVALYAARLPAPYQHGRYVIPALPALIVAGVIGTAWLMSAPQPSVKRRGIRPTWVLTRTLAMAAVLSFAYFVLVVGPPAYRVDTRIIEEEMVATAHWIHDNIPPDELLAVHDIGAVGYFAPREIIDLAGLVSPEVIPIILDEEPLWALMQERDARYLMAFPDQVPGDDVNDPRLCVLFTTNGQTSRSVGGPNMAVYVLTWDGVCDLTGENVLE